MTDDNFLETSRRVVGLSIKSHNEAVERFIRDYIKSHRTCRLDVVLVLGELRYMPPIRMAERDAYEVRFYREVGIRQKLPCSWRPMLPD